MNKIVFALVLGSFSAAFAEGSDQIIRTGKSATLRLKTTLAPPMGSSAIGEGVAKRYSYTWYVAKSESRHCTLTLWSKLPLNTAVTPSRFGLAQNIAFRSSANSLEGDSYSSNGDLTFGFDQASDWETGNINCVATIGGHGWTQDEIRKEISSVLAFDGSAESIDY